ncbi:MAG TPA: hypothetical protein VHR72_12460 [Gemmataceae bacterium]|jgi:hypothetical protein|nr:hypothetical protein [Gemmataceae bacterium]
MEDAHLPDVSDDLGEVPSNAMRSLVRVRSGIRGGFAKRGPRDSRGRSLRDFDLEHRLFKYPCSYLIYSEAFEQLPAAMMDYIYRQLHFVLTGRISGREYEHLSAEDRQAILEILRETKPDLPDYWRQGVKPQ